MAFTKSLCCPRLKIPTGEVFAIFPLSQSPHCVSCHQISQCAGGTDSSASLLWLHKGKCRPLSHVILSQITLRGIDRNAVGLLVTLVINYKCVWICAMCVHALYLSENLIKCDWSLLMQPEAKEALGAIVLSSHNQMIPKKQINESCIPQVENWIS